MPKDQAATATVLSVETREETKPEPTTEPEPERSEEEIFATTGQDLELELAGKKYLWREMGKRKKREMLLTMKPVLEVAGEMVTANEILAGSNAALDWFYKHHKEMKTDKLSIDDKADIDEICIQFKRVRFWLQGLNPDLDPEVLVEMQQTEQAELEEQKKR